MLFCIIQVLPAVDESIINTEHITIDRSSQQRLCGDERVIVIPNRILRIDLARQIGHGPEFHRTAQGMPNLVYLLGKVFARIPRPSELVHEAEDIGVDAKVQADSGDLVQYSGILKIG